MASYRLYLRQKPFADGQYGIMYQYTHKNKKLRGRTGEKVFKKFWDRESNQVREGHPQSDHINEVCRNKLDTIRNIQIELEREGFSPLPHLIKQKLESNKVVTHNATDIYVDYLEFLDTVLKKNPSYMRTNKAVYGSLLKMEDLMGKRLDIREFNYELLKRYIVGLNTGEISVSGKRLVNTSVHPYISMLAGFLEWADTKDYHNCRDYKYFKTQASTFARITPKTRPALTVDEVKALMALKIPTHLVNYDYLEKSRQQFLFLTQVPLRIGDLSTLTYEKIRLDKTTGVMYLILTTQKRKSQVEIPLSNIALRLIGLQGGENEGLVFRGHDISTSFRSHIKILCRMIGMTDKHTVTNVYGNDQEDVVLETCDLITPHCGRYTFASAWYNAGYEVDDLRKFLGHKTKEQTMEYVRSIWTSSDTKTSKYNIDNMYS